MEWCPTDTITIQSCLVVTKLREQIELSPATALTPSQGDPEVAVTSLERLFSVVVTLAGGTPGGTLGGTPGGTRKLMTRLRSGPGRAATAIGWGHDGSQV